MSGEEKIITIKIAVNGKFYTVACPAGEEEELKNAAAFLDKEIGKARQTNQSPVLSDERLIMVTSLNIAHQLNKEKRRCLEQEEIITRRIHASSRQLHERIVRAGDAASREENFEAAL